MKELRRRLALARELRATSKRGRRDVAVYRGVRDDLPLATGPLRGLGLRGVRVGAEWIGWSAVGRAEAFPCARCQNCLCEHGPLDACLIGVIAGVVADRGLHEVTAEQLARVEVDELWDRYGGPAVDWLEGHLSRLEANDEV